MSTVLYIKANAKAEGSSKTFRISDIFIDEYKKYHPEDDIITLDLYKEGVQFLSEADLAMHILNPDKNRDRPVFKYAYQFLDADKYVFSEPLWNLGIPAILKAYIDCICITPVTFKYTDEGVVGLCSGKKAINITTRGGEYSFGEYAEMEMGDRYLKNILALLGITDYTTVAADQLDVIGQDIEAVLSDAIHTARTIAKDF